MTGKAPTWLTIIATWIICAGAFGMVSAELSASPAFHIDTAAGLRFSVPFKVYQRKTPLQIENLIKDALPGELPTGIKYSSAVYSNDSDDFILVWRQPIEVLPTRQELRRMTYLVPLRASSGLSDVAIDETRSAATFAMVQKADQGEDSFKARVAMLLTKKENVFVGWFSRQGVSEAKIKSLLTSIEVDPSRVVLWSELDSGTKPVWSGLIVAAGFLFGFLGFLLVTLVSKGPSPSYIKKSGTFVAPDFEEDILSSKKRRKSRG